MTTPSIAFVIALGLSALASLAVRRGRRILGTAMVGVVAIAIVVVPFIYPDQTYFWLIGALCGVAIAYAFFGTKHIRRQMSQR